RTRWFPIRDAVKHVHATGDHQAGNFGANSLNNVARQARAIRQASSVRTRPFLRSQQLVEQIAVTLLDIDELIAGAIGKLGRRDVVMDETFEAVVREHGIIGVSRLAGRLVNDRTRIQDRVMYCDEGLQIAVPPRMGKLQADDEIVIAAASL